MKKLFRFKAILVTITLFLLVFTSCKKDESSPFNKDLILRDWRVVTIDDEVQSAISTLRFAPNSVFVLFYGDVSVSGIWNWKSDGKTIEVTYGDSSTSTLTVTKLTSADFWFASTDESGTSSSKCVPVIE